MRAPIHETNQPAKEKARFSESPRFATGKSFQSYNGELGASTRVL